MHTNGGFPKPTPHPFHIPHFQLRLPTSTTSSSTSDRLLADVHTVFNVISGTPSQQSRVGARQLQQVMAAVSSDKLTLAEVRWSAQRRHPPTHAHALGCTHNLQATSMISLVDREGQGSASLADFAAFMVGIAGNFKPSRGSGGGGNSASGRGVSALSAVKFATHNARRFQVQGQTTPPSSTGSSTPTRLALHLTTPPIGLLDATGAGSPGIGRSAPHSGTSGSTSSPASTSTSTSTTHVHTASALQRALAEASRLASEPSSSPAARSPALSSISSPGSPLGLFWACASCTFHNPLEARACGMCGGLVRARASTASKASSPPPQQQQQQQKRTASSPAIVTGTSSPTVFGSVRDASPQAASRRPNAGATFLAAATAASLLARKSEFAAKRNRQVRGAGSPPTTPCRGQASHCPPTGGCGCIHGGARHCVITSCHQARLCLPCCSRWQVHEACHSPRRGCSTNGNCSGRPAPNAYD